MHEHFSSYMETTLQLATTQGVVLPPRSTASKSTLTNVSRASAPLSWAPELASPRWAHAHPRGLSCSAPAGA